MDEQKQVKELVRQAYGERARQASSCSTDATCCRPTEIYEPVKVIGLPDPVLAASAGCGDPTALASLKEGEVVLDLGSGGGIDCFFAARSVGESGRVVGIDMTPDMVSLAKGNARKLRTSNVEFLLGELEDLPLADSSVDVVISNCVVNLSLDKDSVFKEAFRVLRPGGRLHVSDVVLDKELPAHIRADAEALVGCIAGADLKDVYLDRMARAGFSGITLKQEGSLGTGGNDPEGVISAKVEALKPL